MPIYYESRLARVELDETEKPKIDAEIAEILTEDQIAGNEQERLKLANGSRALRRSVGSEKLTGSAGRRRIW